MKTKSIHICPGLTSMILVFFTIYAVGSMHPPSAFGLAANIEFIQSAGTVDTYDFVEVTLKNENPDTENPFTDASVQGWFQR